MKLKEFLRGKIGIEVLKYLNNHKEGFVSGMARELKHTPRSISLNLHNLINLRLVIKGKEERARGRGKRRKFYSITGDGIKLINYLEDIKKISRKVSLLLRED